MSTDFPKFAALVSQNVSLMLSEMERNSEPFFVTISGDELWQNYLDSFPAGTDPFFRKATEHTCSCCRNFIKNVGAMVVVKGGVPYTVWDNGHKLPEPYATVAQALEQIVSNLFIGGIYRTAQAKYGAPFTVEMIDGKAHKWHHFSVDVPKKWVTPDAAKLQAEAQSSVQVLRRGLTELTEDSLDTILELIENNGLYRGAEFKRPVQDFKAMYDEYRKLNDTMAQDRFLWINHRNHAARFRNTAIGTLAVDLSEGMDTEKAAEAFGRKLDPLNYKRPKSVITKKQIDQAAAHIKELGLEETLNRRHATLADISVNNVLWVDSEARSVMKDAGSAIHTLLQGASAVKADKAPDFQKAPILAIDEFMDLLPEITSMSLLMENSLIPNLVSLTAPQHGSTGRLFKWNNDFAWSYKGELADSGIAERVKAAGGRVQGAKLRISLAWFNLDDLDLHIFTPNGTHIAFNNRMGILDVDMNAGKGTTRQPVENCSWMQAPRDGVYKVVVNNYSPRENQDFGFDLEVECDGRTIQYGYRKPVKGADGGYGFMSRGLPALEITLKNGIISEIKSLLDMTVGGNLSQEVWGLQTDTLVKVNTFLLSPNFWDGQEIGNQHNIFILEGALNPEPIRGFYNEFLSAELTPHRKVFEVLGSRTKIDPASEQLSGVGFSSTKDKAVSLLIEMLGRKRPVRILFG